MTNAKYTETVAEEGNAEGEILEALAEGMPYAFVVAQTIEPLHLKVASQHDAPTLKALLGQTLKALPGGMGEVSDGYHTFNELYDHRRALTALLAAASTADDSWRSRAHHPEDSEIYAGYFIVGIEFPNGTVTYHYEDQFWDDFRAVPEIEHAPKWDGAGSYESVTRMISLARSLADEPKDE